ncbi:Imm1 family immunity protein [Lentzea sp. E54]|uniref:Imm1 family immunity protein n=1 Tax=Lentzea xerophila TaxID=3435883 RepID=UPI003DA48FD9
MRNEDKSELGALHYVGPDPDDAHGQFGSWASVATEELGGTPPVLYIDRANETPFPPGAAISLDVITKALGEFQLTGNRPTCVQWQRTANIL